MNATRRTPFSLGDLTVRPGRAGSTELPIAKLVTGSPVSLPVKVIHGSLPGPTIWVNAAIHGNEINGVEIIRRVLDEVDAKSLAGTIIAVPIVNVHGFVNGDRYFPDRRDLNRVFPGSPRGSLAGRVAHLFMNEVVSRCTVGIDLHTGAESRTNLPQIRADLTDPVTHQLAEAFGAPVMLHAAIRDGSLRGAGKKAGATVLVYEGGEARRFDESAIAAGLSGIKRVLESLHMIEADDMSLPNRPPTIECHSSTWVRARKSGIALHWVELGSKVTKGQAISQLHDSFGLRLGQLKANTDGIVIGISTDPIVNQGDALVHIATALPEPS